jgi:hypothetical protein
MSQFTLVFMVLGVFGALLLGLGPARLVWWLFSLRRWRRERWRISRPVYLVHCRDEHAAMAGSARSPQAIAPSASHPSPTRGDPGGATAPRLTDDEVDAVLCRR